MAIAASKFTFKNLLFYYIEKDFLSLSVSKKRIFFFSLKFSLLSFETCYYLCLSKIFLPFQIEKPPLPAADLPSLQLDGCKYLLFFNILKSGGFLVGLFFFSSSLVLFVLLFFFSCYWLSTHGIPIVLVL